MIKTKIVLLLLLTALLTGCAVAIGPQAQAQAGSPVIHVDEGATAVVGTDNQVQTPVEPLPAPAATDGYRSAPMWIFLLSVTGLIMGILLGLYLTTREPENAKMDGYY